MIKKITFLEKIAFLEKIVIFDEFWLKFVILIEKFKMVIFFNNFQNRKFNMVYQVEKFTVFPGTGTGMIAFLGHAQC
jgi:hypothetical protein